MSGGRQFAEMLSALIECAPSGSAGSAGQDVVGLGVAAPTDRRPSGYTPGHALPTSEQQRTSLAKAIESEVVPRLMLAHRLNFQAEVRAAKDARIQVSAEDIAEFAGLVLAHDTNVALQYLHALVERGVSAEALYLEWLAPTARLLGEMWKADLCDFADVTIGLSRLQQLLHEISPQFEGEARPPRTVDRRVLLVPVPGEQHTLGLMLVEEFFRREGWECSSFMPKRQSELVRRVRREHFDVVGLSVSCVVLLDQLTSTIQAVRSASLNKGLVVMVGGPVFVEHPEYASQVGADATATDGRDAVRQLRWLENGAAASS